MVTLATVREAIQGQTLRTISALRESANFTTIGQASMKMQNKGVNSLLVMRDRSVVGFLTSKDVSDAIAPNPSYSPEFDPRETPVTEVMTLAKQLVRVSFDETMREAGRLMREQNVRHLPVCEVTGGPIVAVLSIKDVLAALLDEASRLDRALEASEKAAQEYSTR